MPRIEIVMGDITEQRVDAIVNAANRTLLGGGGVDGAIHRAAGPELLDECRTLGGCETGEAKITKGYELPTKFVIHAVGPTYETAGREELLANCCRHCLRLAEEHQLKSIAFPSISTGAYGYPVAEACRIALNTVKEVLQSGSTNVERILFVTFGYSDYREYQRAYKEIFEP